MSMCVCTYKVYTYPTQTVHEFMINIKQLNNLKMIIIMPIPTSYELELYITNDYIHCDSRYI